MSKFKATLNARAPSVSVNIFIAGDIDVIKQACRKYTYAKGLCVTVTPTTYIYTGGQEEGVKVGLINYPKFPSSHTDTVESKATDLAMYLMEQACQKSCTVQCEDMTYHYTREHGGAEVKK